MKFYEYAEKQKKEQKKKSLGQAKPVTYTREELERERAARELYDADFEQAQRRQREIGNIMALGAGMGRRTSSAGRDNANGYNWGTAAKTKGAELLSGAAEGFAKTGVMAEDAAASVLDKVFKGAGFEGTGLFHTLYYGNDDLGLRGIEQEAQDYRRRAEKNRSRIHTGSAAGDKILKKADELGSQLAYGVGNALPMAAEAMATGGGSRGKRRADPTGCQGGRGKRRTEHAGRTGAGDAAGQGLLDKLCSGGRTGLL